MAWAMTTSQVGHLPFSDEPIAIAVACFVVICPLQSAHCKGGQLPCSDQLTVMALTCLTATAGSGSTLILTIDRFLLLILGL